MPDGIPCIIFSYIVSKLIHFMHTHTHIHTHTHTHTRNSVILSSTEYLISKPTILRVYLNWTLCRKRRLYMHVKDKGKAVLKHEMKTLKRTTLVLVILIRKNNLFFFLSSFLPSFHKHTLNTYMFQEIFKID